MSLNNHAARLAEGGQHEQALAVASKASEHFHQPAEAEPDIFGQAASQAIRLLTYLREPEG